MVLRYFVISCLDVGPEFRLDEDVHIWEPSHLGAGVQFHLGAEFQNFENVDVIFENQSETNFQNFVSFLQVKLDVILYILVKMVHDSNRARTFKWSGSRDRIQIGSCFSYELEVDWNRALASVMCTVRWKFF